MDSAKREQVIELGARISNLRSELASLKSQLADAEAELDRLVFNNGSPPNGPVSSVLNLGAAGIVRIPKTAELVIPQIVGNLTDQVLAALKANPNHQLSGEVITDCLNKMVRTSPAQVDSVNAVLSRLTSDGLIVRVERGLYKAKPITSTTDKGEESSGKATA